MNPVEADPMTGPPEADASSQRTPDEREASGDPSNPPGVISVDTKQITSAESEKSFGQLRTPKHANKRDDADSRPAYGSKFHPPKPYEGRQLGGGGAFQPHERRHEHAYYAGGRAPMQVSPGGNSVGGGYYRGPGGPPRETGYRPHAQAGYYDPRYGQMYERHRYEGHGHPHHGYRGQIPHGYQQPRGYNQESGGRGGLSSWGGRPPYHPHSAYPTHDQYQRHAHQDYQMSRAVSSSFDRGQPNKDYAATMSETQPVAPSNENDDASMTSEDGSWRGLKNVHSVDENALRQSLENVEVDDNNFNGDPNSMNSSPANSPPGEEREGSEARQEGDDKQEKVKRDASSLDSLCSAASEQGRLNAGSNKEETTDTPPSPGSIAASLDLMKCHSGSSALLQFPADGKRARDEERGPPTDHEAREAPDGLRRAPSDYEELKEGSAPPSKKAKSEDVEMEPETGDHKKTSPQSISFSPPNTPGGTQKRRGSLASHDLSHQKKEYMSPQISEGFLDKSYSMDLAPSLPKEAKAPSDIPSLPPRPGSSTSSTLAPVPDDGMQVDKADDGHLYSHPPVNSLHSWEIQAQDSFGGGSLSGGHGGLANSFSFQDYSMIPSAESNLATNYGVDDMASGRESALSHSTMQTAEDSKPKASVPKPVAIRHHGHQHSLESRNQSFDGTHFSRQGSFHRSDSMDVSYAERSPRPYGVAGHPGPYPPPSASWATADSSGSYHGPPLYRQPGPYGQFSRTHYPPGPVMRNYSHDSGATGHSPVPHGLPGTRVPQLPVGTFQAPPEFAAPQNQMARRPPPAVYIMSSSGKGDSKEGSMGWSKDDDLRLTEIMKKYKNPRDWDPIAKDFGGSKSAKECHERWIRYLKPGVRKGQWTDHEDAIVMEAVTTSTEQPFTRWSDLAQRLPGRVGKQIRDRWVNHLNPNINHLPFSREDDLLLWEGHKQLGKRWVEISTKFFNSSRSENHIKNRWYSASFKKFIANEFGQDAYSGGGKSKGDSKKKKAKSAKSDIAEVAV